MRLSSSNKFFCFFILLISFFPLQAEDTVDIWKQQKEENQILKEEIKKNNDNNTNTTFSVENSGIQESQISISNNFNTSEDTKPIYGIYDPEENNLSLSMWSQTDGEDIKSSFKRINKINLSNSAEDLFINTILTLSYTPSKNMTEEEFLNLKINWLIKNEKDDLLEEFLNQNKDFKDKKKIIQYLVDKSISQADIGTGCKKSDFIGKNNKSTYLAKFKIYCLIFNDRKNEAQLLYDILREQKLSDKFFEDKINYLLGISDKTTTEIKDDNLLNFYLASVTTKNFSYEPSNKTNKYIWEYLNAANLVKVEDLTDKEKIKTLEEAANNNALDKSKIFEIYKKLPFELNSLINANSIYQSLDNIDARALIYQRYLLSDKNETKIKNLFLLKDLFKKEKLTNIYSELLSDELKKIDPDDIPDSYKQIVKKNIISEDTNTLGRIKYNDKILHKSKVIRYYTEKNTPKQKSQKDLENVYKKIKKNSKYFFSAKDLVLIESLESDGFKIPKEINIEETAQKYNVPDNLLTFAKNGEVGFLILKFVEIIGEDQITDLDPETIYFMTHLLNRLKLHKFRNKILISSLPQ